MRSVLLLSLAVGCTPGLDRYTLESGGLVRSYFVHEPSDAAGDWPVVLVFHGGGREAPNKGRGLARYTGFDEVADEHGLLAVYPNGWKGHWRDHRDIAPLADEGGSDVVFVEDLLDRLEADFPVDPERVYAMGISNGSMFSQRLACDLADRIAGVAGVAAQTPVGLPEACEPARPVPVLLIPGTADPLVPWEGGTVGEDRGEVLSVEASLDYWRDAWACAGEGRVEEVPDRADDGTTATATTWAGCEGGVEVGLVAVQGGGHTWPGARFQYAPQGVVGPTSQDFDAGRRAWSFFD